MSASPSIKLAIIAARFNSKVTDRLLAGAKERLKSLDIDDSCVETIRVPGVVEIPYLAQEVAILGEYDAIICLGAVIQGETDHYEYVCQQVSQGCQKVALKHRIPVIFGVLTTQTDELALARAGGAHGNKGVDAVDAAIEMIEISRRLGNKNKK